MQGTKKDIGLPYQNWLLCLCSLSHSHLSYGLDKLMIFLMGVLKPKGYFLAKQKSLVLQMSLEMQVMCGRV